MNRILLLLRRLRQQRAEIRDLKHEVWRLNDRRERAQMEHDRVKAKLDRLFRADVQYDPEYRQYRFCMAVDQEAFRYMAPDSQIIGAVAESLLREFRRHRS